jgi:regulator of sigma E protease
VTVSRLAEKGGEPSEVEITLPLRRVQWYSTPIRVGSPMTIPSLGIAYQVSNRVRQVQRGSPAAKAGLKNGSVILEAKLILPDLEEFSVEELGTPLGRLKQRKLTLEFAEDKAKWPALVYALQDRLPGTLVELTLEGDKKVTLTPTESTEWFYPDRGLGFDALAFTQTAGSFSEAVVLGTREALDALTVIFRTLKSLGTGQVSLKGLSGPVGIVHMAYRSASSGMGDFLTFLCLISANLAVINFLPIPVLDGGHILFLTYEGVRGKPPSEGVFVALSYLGLAFILLLMVWVLGLDFGLISR